MTADAIIIGSGPGGSTAADVLTAAGWSVVIIEKGRNHLIDPDDMPSRRPTTPTTRSSSSRATSSAPTRCSSRGPSDARRTTGSTRTWAR